MKWWVLVWALFTLFWIVEFFYWAMTGHVGMLLFSILFLIHAAIRLVDSLEKV